MLVLFSPVGNRWRHRHKLSSGDVMDITNKVVSGVQAALSCLTGVIVCKWSCTRSVARASHFMSEAYAWFGASYFFYDIWSMYITYMYSKTGRDLVRPRLPRRLNNNGDAMPAGGDWSDERKFSGSSFLEYCKHDPVIIMHHLFIGGFGFFTIIYLRGGLGDCIFGFVYLMELSTPFVSLRSILSRLKLKQTQAYVINGLMMVASFFVCRVASLPYAMLLYSRELGLPYFELKQTQAYVINGLMMVASFFVCRVASLPYAMLLYSRELGLPYFEAINTLPTGCKISICILLLPQLYWFYLMSSGAVKVLSSRSNTPPVKEKKPKEKVEKPLVAASDVNANADAPGDANSGTAGGDSS